MAIDQAVKVDADKTLMDVFREGLFTRALGYPRSRNPYLAGRLNFSFGAPAGSGSTTRTLSCHCETVIPNEPRLRKHSLPMSAMRLSH
jgi:hypothetical protein